MRRDAKVREPSRRVASNVAPRTSPLPRGKRKISGSLVEKSVAESGVRRSWPFMSACCTVASADNFFPGVKSLSSPPRFPKTGDCTWFGGGGGRNAPWGVGKFYVVGRVRGRAATFSWERDQELSLGEDTTLTIRAHAKQLSLSPPPPPLRLFLLDVLMEYVEKMRSAHGMITETLRFLDPVECSLPLKRKIFLNLHKTISRFRALADFWQKKFGYSIAVLNDCR